MASKKKLLQAAAGAAGGAAGLDVDEVFSTYLYNGNGAGLNIINGINLGDNVVGSVDFDGTGDSLELTTYSWAYGTGDFTIEFWIYLDTLSGTTNVLDQRPTSGVGGLMIGFNSSQQLRFFKSDQGNLIADTVATSTGSWHHVAVTRASGTTRLFKNGSLIGSASSDTFNYTTSMLEIGQRSTSDGNEVDGKMSNVRIVIGTAVYTSAFTVPTEPLTAISGTELLICTGDNFKDKSSNNHEFTVKGNPAGHQDTPFSTSNTGEGGLVWLKERTSVGGLGWHSLFDTARGTAKYLSSNNTNAEASSSGVTAFNSNGFTLGDTGLVNQNTGDFVSWTFRKAPKFFDVVQFTVGSTGTDTIINHSLGSDVGMVITKLTSTTSNWGVHHRDLVSANEYMFLDTTLAAASFDTVSFSSTQVDLGTFWSTNNAGETGIAYIFAHNNGDGGFGPDGSQDIIKCGSFTSDSSGIATVNLGFEPQWLMFKGTHSGSSWHMVDVMRGMSNGSNDAWLAANLTNAEASYAIATPTPTGFVTDGTTIVDPSSTFIYMAIRRGPLAAPESATDVFAMDDAQATSGSGPAFISNFTVDMLLEKQPSTTGSWPIGARLQGNKYLVTDGTGAETTGTSITWDYMNGAFDPFSGTAYQAWNWKRAPSYFDVVAYSGTGSARTVSHNLGVAPEMMWVKSRSNVSNWQVYHSALGNTKYLELNNTNQASTNSARWNDTTPTSSVFTLGTDDSVNDASRTYIAYLFATVANVSKVGSVSHSFNSTTNVDCGFSSGARFVLVKSTSSGDWYVWDSVRGIVAGNDPYLALNKTDAEVTNGDLIDPYSGGFALSPSFYTDTYIFYAIA